MKALRMVLPLLLGLFLLTRPEPVRAQLALLEVIKAGVKKVIRAADLKVQRLQNETIWLQNAQKVLENSMSKLKLTEIADWTARQRELYHQYYEELWRVKATIAYYQRVKEVTKKQLQIVNEYKRAWGLLNKDPGFRPEELDYMASVYAGILEASLQNLDQIILITSSLKTQMSDAGRMELISAAADRIDSNFDDLQEFNRGNILTSLQRAKQKNTLNQIKELYGIKQ